MLAKGLRLAAWCAWVIWVMTKCAGNSLGEDAARGVLLGHLGQPKHHDLNDLKRKRGEQKTRGAFGSFGSFCHSGKIAPRIGGYMRLPIYNTHFKVIHS